MCVVYAFIFIERRGLMFDDSQLAIHIAESKTTTSTTMTTTKMKKTMTTTTGTHTHAHMCWRYFPRKPQVFQFSIHLTLKSVFKWLLNISSFVTIVAKTNMFDERFYTIRTNIFTYWHVYNIEFFSMLISSCVLSFFGCPK